MDSFDVAVVGYGPTGATLALALGRCGHRVVVFERSDALLRDLNRHARARLGTAVAPREIEIIDVLPKTRSGKIMRRLLKARELGLPEGDTSTLEDD